MNNQLSCYVCDEETGRSVGIIELEHGEWAVIYDPVVDTEMQLIGAHARFPIKVFTNIQVTGQELLAEYKRWIVRDSANAAQVGGDHYVKHGDFQPWDAWWHWKLNAFQGAIIKYVVRYRDKGGVEDLKKARHCIDKLIELEESECKRSI